MAAVTENRLYNILDTGIRITYRNTKEHVADTITEQKLSGRHKRPSRKLFMTKAKGNMYAKSEKTITNQLSYKRIIST